MARTLIGIVVIALIGQIAGAIDGSIRSVRTTAAPVDIPVDADNPQAETLGFYLDVPQAQALYEAGEVVFADARPIDQYEEGHIAGAEHLDPDAFSGGDDPDFIYIYPMDQRIVIYCPGGECDASDLVAIRLQDFGYTSVHVLKPGYPGWVEAGLPTEAGANE